MVELEWTKALKNKNLSRSEGKKANYPRYYRMMQETLAKEQRILSRRKRGSHGYEKQRMKVGKIHEKIANQRKDFLHKQSRLLANTYDCVVVEDLNMHGMSKALHFGKSVHDNGWGMLTTLTSYKLQEQGKKFLKIDKWYPSSKLCSCCGHVLSELSLVTREWICPNCNTFHDRDENAASNIRNEGLRMLA